jgi:hypothetical protein
VRYSLLRYKTPVQFGLFVVTTGLLTFLSQVGLWAWFWSVFVVAAAAYGLLMYVESASFTHGLRRLRDQEFRLATQFERVHASDIFLMADPAQQLERNRLTQRILAEGNRFSLATLTAASYIDPQVDRHWQTLKGRLDAGCTLRLLLQDPLCVEKQIRDRRNRPDGGRDSKLDLASVLRLTVRYPDQFRVRFTSTNIYAAVFFSESGLTYDPYHLGMNGARIENRFITIAYEKREPSVDIAFDHYALLASHFNYLWSDCSQDLVGFLRENQDQLAGMIGASLAADVKNFLSVREKE